MTPEEYDAYNESLKKYRHMNIVVDEYKETIAVKNKTIAAMKKKNAEQGNSLQKALAEIAEYQRRYGVLTGLN